MTLDESVTMCRCGDLVIHLHTDTMRVRLSDRESVGGSATLDVKISLVMVYILKAQRLLQLVMADRF